jgi:hypothetical protein
METIVATAQETGNERRFASEASLGAAGGA